MEKISKSGKKAVNMLMETSKNDVRSVTGKNLRNIMLLAGKDSIEDVKKGDVDGIEYNKLDENDVWKVDAIKEIISVKSGTLEVPGFELEELQEILSYLCTS